jgi:hypothetical protein
MQNSQIAPVLDQILHQDLNPAIRLSVMEALTTRRRVQRQWFGDDGSGCFWAIATMEVTGMRPRYYKEIPDKTQVAAKTFGVTEKRVEEGFIEWDGLERAKLNEFIANLRVEVAMIKATHATSPPASQNQQPKRGLMYQIRERIGV